MGKPAIAIAGLAGTGTSTAAKIVAETLGWKYVTGGGIMRELAAEQGISIEAFTKSIEGNADIDKQLDERLLDEVAGTDVIVEGRAFVWLLPETMNCLKVWLTCEDTERFERVHQRDVNEDVADTERRVKQREAGDLKRYQDLYDIDLNETSVFDLIIDTTKIPPQSVADRIIAAVG